MKEIFDLMITLLGGIPTFKWVDKDKKQLDVYETKPSVSFPCALFKIAITSCQTVAPGRQICTGSLTVRTAYDLAMKETSAAAPQEARDRSTQFYGDADAVFIKLQSYTDAQIDQIDRVSCIEEDRRDDLTVMKSIFTITFEQDTDG